MIKKNMKCVGLIFGGNSNEHSVSISSAKTVFNALNIGANRTRFKVKAFYIDRNGIWLDNEQSIKILKNEVNIIELGENFIFSGEKFNFLEKIEFKGIDIWFPLLHGLNGEDGAIQGLLKFSQKPFIGSGILGSALGMDKILMKTMFDHLKIPQVKYFSVQNSNLDDYGLMLNICDQIIKKLNYPMFVKPANSGSSIGVSKVKNKFEMITALKKAWELDSRIIVEEGLEVREIECGIIGNSKLLASEIGEVSYSSDWYDFKSKYSKNNKIIIPAAIDSKTSKKIKDLAIKSCKALNIYGFARVDFFLEKSSNKLYLNEINTIPGFTNKSMFPMLWNASGLDINQLVAKLVDITSD